MKIRGENLLDKLKNPDFLGLVACNDPVFEQPEKHPKWRGQATDEMRMRNKSARFGERLVAHQPFDTNPERRRNTGKGGLSHTREYTVWSNMMMRCYWPQMDCFDRYGGRGIGVCQRWRERFESFLEDIGRIPEGWELDRIDYKGDYSPENCRLVDRRTQCRNRRSNHLIEWRNPHSGEQEVRCMVNWAEVFGVHISGFKRRIYKYGYANAFAYAQRKFDKRRRQQLAITHNPYAFFDVLEA